jgi:hypothetical protein
LSRRAVAFTLEELGDAEVEQLDLAVGAHQHVRGLQVPVHDQVRVCVRDRGRHVEEQPDPRLGAQAVGLAIGVDVRAVHVL